jgi:GNAT superfamily N-acetyltransferase
MRRALPIEGTQDVGTEHDGIAATIRYRIRTYDPACDHDRIPDLYAAAFDEAPWDTAWDEFSEFDSAGVFIAETEGPFEAVGFAICFRRHDFGYISDVGVAPAHRRRGIASAMVRRCAGYLTTLDLDTVRIDAYEDRPHTVERYRSLGFRVHEVVDDPGPPEQDGVLERGDRRSGAEWGAGTMRAPH